MSVTREDVLNVLKSITNPATGTDLVASDIVRALTVEGGNVRFVMEVDPAHGTAMEPVRLDAVEKIEALPGVGQVSALLTAHSTPKPPPDLKIGRHPTAQSGPAKVPGVNAILAIASGKGGVGKSTVSANLGRGARRRGQESRHARCRCLWPLAAAHAGHLGTARKPRWQDHPAAPQPRRHADVDRPDDEGGRGRGLARPDAHGRAPADAGTRCNGASSTC